MPLAATWIDLGNIMLSETDQTEKNKYYMLSLTLGLLNIKQMNIYSKTRNRLTDIDKKLGLTSGEREGKMGKAGVED